MKGTGRGYRLLLHAYPRAFRDRFGPAMAQAFRDRRRLAAARGPLAVAALILHTLLDTLVNATALRAGNRERVPMNWPSLVIDARYACRMFRRAPLFTLLAVSALALGIGANTAIFTIVNGVLLKPLPYSDPERLVMVWSTNAVEHRDHDVVSPLDFLDYKKAGAFDDLQAAFSFVASATLTGTGGAARQVVSSVVSPGMVEMLGRRPLLGRAFTDRDPANVVLVSHAFWTSTLGADPAALGRVLIINQQPWTVIGVMPSDFVFPYRTMLGPTGFTRSTEVDVWLPMQFVDAEAPRTAGGANLVRGVRWLSVVGRLKPGASVTQANAEIAGIAAQLSAQYGDTNRAVGATVVPLHDQAVGGLRPALLLVLGGVGVVLLMACVNLANLLLARSTARQREMAVRSALGAGRRRLMTQALVETLLLALAGGLLALIVVNWGIAALVALAPADMPRIGEVRPDAAVLGFTFALALITGLAIGLVPAVAASRPELQSALQGAGRGATSGPGQRRLRGALVVAEVALSVVLTLGAGLLLRSFVAVLSIDPGFRSNELLTMQIALPAKYQTADQRRAFYAELFRAIEAVPGVTSAGGTTRLPLGSTNVSIKVGIEGHERPPGEWPEAEFRRAVHDYFAAMGIPVIRGRGFSAQDGPSSPAVVVINQTMARQMFPGEEPVGKRIRLGTPAQPWSTIVGVIGDIRHSGLETAASPEVYVWYLQNPPINPFLVLRTAGPPSAVTSAVRGAVQGIDRDIAAYDIRPMTQVRSDSVAPRRFVLMLVAAFGVLALVMAAVGVYGVMALIVSERTPEIGLRLALGARPSQVMRTVVAQGLTLAATGVGIGLLAAASLAPLLTTQLYGIQALDPPTLAGVPVILLLVAALACYVPARRAMGVDPVNALRG
ncbi:MAG: ABC transporter permease [Vicinamibacterales bacterium]